MSVPENSNSGVVVPTFSLSNNFVSSGAFGAAFVTSIGYSV